MNQRKITNTPNNHGLNSVEVKLSGERGLSQQYGGIHSGGWVDTLPKSWVPYIQLCRLSPPIGFILIFFPHLFGVAHAATLNKASLPEALYAFFVLSAGSLFCSNTIHAWNDLVDAPLDAQIERTKTRPIPRGAISLRAAFTFTCSQAILAALCLLLLPYETSVATIPSLFTNLYYPFAKRHTYFPQVVLGFCLSWGVIIGSSAMGIEKPWYNKSTMCLMGASALWVILFDTIYAHQDLKDDLKVGVKSIAVLFDGRTKPFLCAIYVIMNTLLFYSGRYAQMDFPYYVITVGGCISSVGAMITLVDLRDPKSCWGWFANGFWTTATSIFAGLVVTYTLGEE